jgi:hypothetical protein
MLRSKTPSLMNGLAESRENMGYAQPHDDRQKYTQVFKQTHWKLHRRVRCPQITQISALTPVYSVMVSGIPLSRN